MNERDIADRVHSAAIRLLRSLRAVDVQSGVSGPKLSLLSVLVFGGPMSLRQLADAQQVRPPTMTRLVQDAEAEGLVRRRADPSDGRRHVVEASAAGRKLLQTGRARRLAEIEGRLNRLKADDRRALARAVAALERLAAP